MCGSQKLWKVWYNLQVGEIVSLGKTISLNVYSDNVEELVKKNKSELTTKELKTLYRKQQEVVKVISSSKKENIPNTEIKELP